MAALLSPLSEDPWAAPPAAATAVAPTSTPSSGYGFSAPSSSPNAATTTTGILDEDSLPAVYAQACQAALSASSSGGSTFTSFGTTNAGYVNFTALHKILSGAAGLSASETEKIITLITSRPSTNGASPAGSMTDSYAGALLDSPLRTSTTATPTRIARSEFYVALALAALAQQRQPMSIQALLTRRDNPPVPKLDLASLPQGSTIGSKPSASWQSGFSTSPVHSRAYKLSLGSSGDPWSSSPTAGPSAPSAFTNGYKASPAPYSVPEEAGPSSGFKASYTSPSGNGTSNSGNYTGGYSSFPSFGGNEEDQYSGHSFGDSSDGGSGGDLQGLESFSSAAEFSRSLTRVDVLQQAEIAGSFWDRHTVYLVMNSASRPNGHARTGSTASRASSNGAVVRRYSDWVWLNEVLERKYPARMRPTLPPKRVGISARHLPIAADELFLERRRKSLARYLEFVANHHVMKHERCVQVFLNEPVDLAAWRKADLASALPASAPGQDETSSGPTMSPTQLSSIPTSFDGTLANLRESLPLVLESMARFIALLERIASRDLANSADLLRAKMALDSFGEALGGISGTTSSSSTGSSNGQTKKGSGGRPRETDEDTLILARDMTRFSTSLSVLAENVESHSGQFSAIQIERLKALREVWRSLLALLKAYDGHLRVDAVDKLKKRIESSQGKYQSLASVAVANRKPNHAEELEKLLKSIEEDQNGVQKALERRERVRYQVAQEVRVAWRWSTVLRVELADWAANDSAHFERLSNVWGSLTNALVISD